MSKKKPAERAEGTWVAEVDDATTVGDGADSYVTFRFSGGRGLGSDEDESLAVYLPKDPDVRNRAARLIARALNRARIPGPPFVRTNSD